MGSLTKQLPVQTRWSDEKGELTFSKDNSGLTMNLVFSFDSRRHLPASNFHTCYKIEDAENDRLLSPSSLPELASTY